MLVLSRKAHEELVLVVNDETIYVSVLGIQGNKVAIGVTALEGVKVYRGEIYSEVTRREAAERTGAQS